MMSNKTVISAISGGVDSSVATAIYKEKGYNIIGVTLKLCKNSSLSQEEENAKKICDKLGIKHIFLEREQEFKDKVLSYSFNECKIGRTPNPCAFCNRNLKFAEMFKIADQYNADYVITGHYTKTMKKNGNTFILRGDDPKKDQSYFLCRLTKEQLKKIKFPLGKMTKSEVREIARSLNLESAESSESQDICFVQKGQNFQDELAKTFNYTPIPGNIIDKNGKVLGRHVGIYKYTIGQRKGLNVAMGKPAFVSEIRANTNEIVLSTDSTDLMSTGLTASDFNWFCDTGSINEAEDFYVQIRYRHKAVKSKIKLLKSNVQITFSEPQRAVTLGQIAAVYKDNLLLGGGWISEKHN